MKNRRVLLTLVVILCAIYTSSAQEFATPATDFSISKPMYVTLKDGKEIEGKLKYLKYKKGLIQELVIVDSTGTKSKLMPENIEHMYLMPSGFDKLKRLSDFASDATKWGKSNISADVINKGYVYFEQAVVELKNGKQINVLMQLLNPTFCSKVKVFHDPYAGETASAGFAGVKLAGGVAKSYYVKKYDEVAFKALKKDYDEQFVELYSDCETVNSKYSSDISWYQFKEHIIEYNTECN